MYNINVSADRPAKLYREPRRREGRRKAVSYQLRGSIIEDNVAWAACKLREIIEFGMTFTWYRLRKISTRHRLHAKRAKRELSNFDIVTSSCGEAWDHSLWISSPVHHGKRLVKDIRRLSFERQLFCLCKSVCQFCAGTNSLLARFCWQERFLLSSSTK